LFSSVENELTHQEIDETRTCTRQQRVYGSEKLRQQIETLTNRVVGIRPPQTQAGAATEGIATVTQLKCRCARPSEMADL
jgi:hypothetical protein